MTFPLSRPKIHRPPAVVRDSRTLFLPSLALASVLALIVIGVSANRMIMGSSAANAVAELPELLPPTTLVPVSPAGESADSIVIQGEKQAIIGQLTRMPTQNQQITGITSVSNVDKDGGRDLLSIVGKH